MLIKMVGIDKIILLELDGSYSVPRPTTGRGYTCLWYICQVIIMKIFILYSILWNKATDENLAINFVLINQWKKALDIWDLKT